MTAWRVAHRANGLMGMHCVGLGAAIAVWLASNAAAFGESPFAVSVIDYAPAPGQFVNNPEFNDPNKVLGPPIGGGITDGNESSVVTLGGFGGFITLRFDHMVEDHPLNPFGMDAIVFGNAFWVGDRQRHWAECAVIEIALDVNANGRPDEDEWYLIPGSHITDLNKQYTQQTWDADVDDPTYPPSLASWIPEGQTGMWQTEGFLLPPELFAQNVVVNPSVDEELEGIFGYAEYAPTLQLGDLDADNVIDDPLIAPELFYTRPDNPFTVGITAHSGGGDAFDVAWAIHPVTGAPARLEGFDFIRITNGNNTVVPRVGELSPEIDAVADVTHDPFGDVDEDKDIDLKDVAAFQNCTDQSEFGDGPCSRADRDGDERVQLEDWGALTGRLTGPKR